MQKYENNMTFTKAKPKTYYRFNVISYLGFPEKVLLTYLFKLIAPFFTNSSSVNEYALIT